MFETIIIYVFAPVLTALLLWIGWLIKQQINIREEQRKQLEEYSLSMAKVTDYLDTTVTTLAVIIESLKVSLQCHDIEFRSMHDSGVMNGESVEQRAKIDVEIVKLEEKMASIANLLNCYRDDELPSKVSSKTEKETA